jgi:hypothetical protein
MGRPAPTAATSLLPSGSSTGSTPPRPSWATSPNNISSSGSIRIGRSTGTSPRSFIGLSRVVAPDTWTFPPGESGLPSRFLADQELTDQLRRCLNDDTMPLDVRIIGALVRLYALPVMRILELTIDRFHRADDHAYLTISHNPVLLPPRLASLVEQQITQPRRLSTLRGAPGMVPDYLFPGRPSSRPRNASGVSKLMAQHNLPSDIAHNTAMIEAVTELPPIVVSDLFGIAPKTAHAWAQLAQEGWAGYLAASAPEV